MKDLVEVIRKRFKLLPFRPLQCSLQLDKGRLFQLVMMHWQRLTKCLLKTHLRIFQVVITEKQKIRGARHVRVSTSLKHQRSQQCGRERIGRPWEELQRRMSILPSTCTLRKRHCLPLREGGQLKLSVRRRFYSAKTITKIVREAMVAESRRVLLPTPLLPDQTLPFHLLLRPLRRLHLPQNTRLKFLASLLL